MFVSGMKNYLIILFCLCFLSCSNSKIGINIKKDVVSIDERGVSFRSIILLINQEALKQTGLDVEESNTTIHYSNLGGKKIDLVFKKVKNDSLLFYQISARLVYKPTWLSTDTLKVLFSTSNSIQRGIYSILYGPVFCWTKPVQFTNFSQIGKKQDIQFAYWKYINNIYACAMPLGGNGFAFSLGNEKKGFGAVGTTGYKLNVEGEIPILALSISSDFYKLIPSTFHHSFKAMGIADNLRVKKNKPEMFNYLGWATWNSYKHNVSEEKIINSAKYFKTEQIPVKWFLIDDGWLDIADNKLNSYVPDKKKFPAEFKDLTLRLKKEFGINNVGVWHTLNGYWEGLNDSGKLTKSFNDIITYYDQIVWLSKTVKPLHFVNPFSVEGYRFYDDWYNYLTSQGISFVKVDNQLVVRRMAEGNSSFWQTGEKVFSNLHSASTKYFQGNIINCMGMTNSDFYHYSNLSVARTVEDFNPDSDDKLFSCEFDGNAASHIVASVHNSVWLSNIVWPDYDMFQSNAKDAWYYAISKVMSDGPVYITDEPGKHDATLLRSITFSNGKVISADKPALPTEDCLFQLFESGKPFKVFSEYNDNGLIATWNVSDKDTVKGTFSPSEVRGLNGKQFVVFEFFSKSVFEADLNDESPIRLDRMGCKFFSVIPLTKNKAIIGDISKVIPMAAVSNLKISEKSIQLEVTEPCILWIYSKSMPVALKINSKTIEKINYNNNILSVNVDKSNSKLDIEF